MKKNYIALGGLFACLHVLFLLLSKIIIGSELLLVLFLPLLSTIYTLKCENKKVFMFCIATVLFCCFFDLISTFIYVIPSLVCGVVYGVLRKNKCKELELLCISGLVHMLTISFSFLVIVFLFKEVDFLKVFEKAFSLEGENLFIVTLVSLLVLGFCEAFLVHVITDNELAKIDSRVEKNETVPKWFLIPLCFSLLTFIVVNFFSNKYSVFPMIVFFVFFIPYIVEGIMNLKYKFFTFFLIIVFFAVAIFAMGYIDSLNYLMLPVFILSPFAINNFEYDKEKTFKSKVNDIK